LDLCISLLSSFVVKFSNIKIPRGSNESKYRASKHDIIYADSTKARIYSAWTQGSLFAPKIGELFSPEHPPLPRRSLAQWIVKLKESHRESATPASPPPQIEKLRRFSSIDAMEDESHENSDNGSLYEHQMASAKDDEMKQQLHNEMSKNLPAVCDFLEVI
jgi:hypothetical protein